MVESVEDVTLAGIRHDMVEAIWEKAKPHLEQALEYGDGEFQIDDVLKFLLDRTMQLWVLYVFEDWAREQGCTQMEALARKGMAKKLIKLDYKPIYQVSRKKL